MEIAMTEDTEDMPELDMASINEDIAAGAKAYGKLLRNATDDWKNWDLTIRGLRALRNLAFAQSRSNNLNSQAYRQAMSALLQQRKYSIYNNIDTGTRSTCYKLMDNIEEISLWYETLSAQDQLRWKHPDTIAKHCPSQLVKKGERKAKEKGKKKKTVPAEVERLRALLIKVIRRLMVYEPDAVELLDQVGDPGDPDDDVSDLFAAPIETDLDEEESVE